jgi:peptidoglycan-associated lipoprotein
VDAATQAILSDRLTDLTPPPTVVEGDLVKRTTQTTLAMAATLAVLAGCQTSPEATRPTAAAPVQTRSVAPATAAATPATTAGAPQSQVASVNLAGQQGGSGAAGAGAFSGSNRAPGSGAAGAAGTAMLAAPAQRVVYFDFDSFAIKDDFKGMLDGHAKALAAAKTKRAVVEGHADERGGREYNLALGQKRAEAVAKSLSLLGVGAGQLEAVSFGEERPAAQGADESAWSRNRRAELKDR